MITASTELSGIGNFAEDFVKIHAAWACKAIVLYRLDRKKESEDYAEKAIELDPSLKPPSE